MAIDTPPTPPTTPEVGRLITFLAECAHWRALNPGRAGAPQDWEAFRARFDAVLYNTFEYATTEDGRPCLALRPNPLKPTT